MQPIEAPTDPRVFHDRIYGGEILCFRRLPAMAGLVEAVRALLEADFSSPPVEAHGGLSHGEQVARFTALQRAAARAPEIKDAWRALFEALGLAPSALAHDKLHLRFQPPVEPGEDPEREAATAPLAFHRDTWGSNLYAQVNWWAPVYPIEAGRTVALYPELWERSVKNTSADFDLPGVIEGRRTRSNGKVFADEAIPHLAEPLDPALAVPLVVEPGDLLAFSGAHAHARGPNRTPLMRISLETRTLWIEDLKAGRGAPNVDGAAPWMAPGWFKRGHDGAKLSDLLGLEPVVPYDPPPAARAGAGNC
ncbi:MAG: hypothetical protein AAGF90_12115 [Pseudomonadota bacterium]